MIPIGVLGAAHRDSGGTGDPVAISIYSKLTNWLPLDVGLADAHGAAAVDGSYSGAAGKVGSSAATARNSWQQDSPATTGRASFGAWFYMTSDVGCVLQGYASVVSSGESISLGYESGGRFRAFMRNNAKTPFVYDEPPGSRSLNAWYFVGADFDNGTVSLRVNAALIGSVALGSGVVQSTTRFQLGSIYSMAIPGMIDEPFLCHGAKLSDEEWSYLYNAGAGMSYAALKSAAGF